MKKHQIKIRAITQFNATQLAIADDGKAGVMRDTVQCVLRHTMPGGEVIPGQPQGLSQHHFGDVGEVVADDHQRHRACHIGCRHMQHRRLFELAQGFHLLFQIVIGDGAEPFSQIAFQRTAVQRRVERARIQQFIEQYRLTRQQARQPWAGSA